jgi:hypothetical protein
MELIINGMDDRDDPGMSFPECLETLRKYETDWTTANFSSHLKVATEDEWGRFYYDRGLAMIPGRSQLSTFEISVHQLPSSLRRINHQTWKIPFEQQIEEMPAHQRNWDIIYDPTNSVFILAVLVER